MLTLAMSAPLAALLTDPDADHGLIRPVRIDADDWAGAVAEIRARFPRLAARVFTDAGRVRPGFLVAVNEQVAGDAPDVHPGDEVFLLVQIAGG
jgi:molybdopterin converting factor small subunit